MPIVHGPMPAMQSVYRQAAPDIAPPAPAEGDVSDAKRLLQAVWWLSRKWVESLAVHDPQRVKLIHLGILTDDLVRVGDYSSAALTTVRTLLCTHCRRLDAARGRCLGQSLDRCQLLREPSH